MKKKLTVVLFLTLGMSILAVSGCGKKESKKEEEATEIVAEEVTEEPTEELQVPIPEEPSEEIEYDFGQVGPDTVSDSIISEDFAVESTETVSQPVVESAAASTGSAEVTAMNDTKLYAKESVRIRREPNTDSEIAGKLAAGDEVTANGKAGDWYRITRNGESLYVKGEYLTETKPEKKEETGEQTAETEQTAENSESSSNAAAATTVDPLAAAAAVAAAANTATANSTEASSSSSSSTASSTEAASTTSDTAAAATDTAAADAAAQAAIAQAAATASAGATYDLNGLKVNATEYKALLDTWRWATANGTDEEAKEYVLHHPAGDLEAVLKSKGLR